MTLFAENWLIVLVALVAAILIGWYIFHAARRTRVTTTRRDVLDEGAAPAERNRALIDSPVAANRDLPLPPATPAGLAGMGEAVGAAVEAGRIEAEAGAGAQADASVPPSELGRLKGVGPKLVARLRELGITRLAQVAEWDEAAVDRFDAELGRFAGRIRRDSWVDQARLLTRGDDEAFAERFGKMN